MSAQLRATIKLADGGRIVIPAEIRERLGLKPGSNVVMSVNGDQATLMSLEASLRHAQDLVAKFIKPGKSLSKELIAERRREAERE